MTIREAVLRAYEENRVGECILTYRAKHNISQAQFAAIVGVTMQTIYSIETKQTNPSKLTLEKIILILEGDEKDESKYQQDKDIQSM